MEDNTKDIERAQKKQDQMLQEQINMQNAQLEEKKQEVFRMRKRNLDAMAGQTWAPAPVPMAPAKPKKKSNVTKFIIKV